MDTKDKTSMKGSKTNVAESNQPLLETPGSGEGKGNSPERERIEIESIIEKDPKDKGQDGADGERRRLRTCIDNLTMSMNLLDRDSIHINDHINVAFEDVLAEPRSDQGFDQTWRLAYVLFAGTKFWVYRVLAAACALPCGLVWGLLFSLLSIASVWIITPTMKIIDVLLHVVKRVWTGVVHAVLDPIFQSASLLRGGKSQKKQVAAHEVV